MFLLFWFLFFDFEEGLLSFNVPFSSKTQEPVDTLMPISKKNKKTPFVHSSHGLSKNPYLISHFRCPCEGYVL